MGFIDQKNRAKNIKLLATLLSMILKKWPDVEFMSSDELGYLIEKDLVTKKYLLNKS